MSTTADDRFTVRTLVQQLRNSELYREYESSFTEVTGLPMAMHEVDSLASPFRESRNQSPFCVLMATTNESCSACLELQHRVELGATFQTKTLECFAGLSESKIPVRVGAQVVAFLQTGQVFLHQPTSGDFKKTARALLKRGAVIDVKRLEAAYFQTRVLTRSHYAAVLRLLAIFARHLAALSNQLVLTSEASEAPIVTKAKKFIAEHQAEELGLRQVALSVHISSYYFCKRFRKETGLTFTDYLARVRIETVKGLLQNRHKRISEAAFQAGFQSLSQFNRVFRRITGDSPAIWREKMLRDSAA